MRTPRIIVVGVDFSPTSREALRKALDYAEGLGARVEVVHVVHDVKPALPFSPENCRVVEALRRTSVEQAKQALRKLLPRQTKVRIRTRVLEGTPDEELLGYAKRVRAGLIVLGDVGHSPVGDFLIGSTAERCLRKTRIPVLLVPSRRTRRP